MHTSTQKHKANHPSPPSCPLALQHKQNYLPQQDKHLSARLVKSPCSVTERVCTHTLSQTSTCLQWGWLSLHPWCNPIFCQHDPMRNDNASPGPCALTCGVVGAGEQHPPAKTILPFPPLPLQPDACPPPNQCHPLQHLPSVGHGLLPGCNLTLFQTGLPDRRD